jgi:catechol 2,3-dioxygenase-like lactoylglutathione lyase family enzyme
MAAASLAENSITHLNLDVADLETSERFYGSVLGLPVSREAAAVRVRTPTFLLVLARGTPQMGGSFHFGFRVASRQEVDDWFAHFRERAVGIVELPLQRGAVYVGRITDPDGYPIEIYCEL